METVEISKMEYEFACFVGIQRSSARIFSGSAPAYGADLVKGQFDMNLSGAIAEYVVAKYLGCYWSYRPEDMRFPDVGGAVEVRSTPHAEGYLRLHDRDKNEAPYVLVLTHEMPRLHLAGWILGADGKVQDFFSDKWNTNRPAYWIGQDKLLPMSALKERYWAWANKKGA